MPPLPPAMPARTVAFVAELDSAIDAKERDRALLVASLDSEISALRQERAQIVVAFLPVPVGAPIPDERHMYKGGSLWTVAGRHGAEKRDREMRWRAGALVVEYFYTHGSNTRALRKAGVGTQERGGGWYSVAELNQYCRQAVSA